MISRYSVKKINDIFSDRRKYENWLKIELLLLRYLSGLGYLKASEAERIEAEVAIFPTRIREEERKIKHDVAAFVNCISRTVTSEGKKWIHYGLTSSDLVDTGNAMALKEANDIIVEHAYRILRRLKYLSYRHKKTYYLRREGGRIRGVSSFGHMLSKYYSLVREFIDRFSALRRHVECASLSGSVGTCSYLGTDFQEYAANQLGLFSVPISTQVVSRDRYYSYFSLLAHFGQIMNKLSIELRLLTKTEIGEVAEAFERQQIGSSSMPHKRNPITLENICGLSRLLDGYLSASSKNSLIWFERDISHSSADRVLFVDGISIALQIMKRMAKVLETLYVNVDRMGENIEKNIFTVLRPRLCRFLLERKFFHSRKEAEFYLEELNEGARESGIHLREAFAATPYAQKITAPELQGLFDFDVWFGYLDRLYRRIFGDSMERSDFEEIYYEQAEINYSIELLAERLNYEYRNSIDPISLLFFRDGCSVFLSRILFRLRFPVELKTINTSLIRYQKLNDGGNIPDIDLEESFIKRRNVLVMDELIDTGTTMDLVREHLKRNRARTIRTCALFYADRKEIREKVDFLGLPVDTARNMAGFGIDVGGKYRNLGFVGRVKEINAN